MDLREDEIVPDALVVALQVVVSGVLFEHILKWVRAASCDTHLACTQMNKEKHVVGDQSESAPPADG